MLGILAFSPLLASAQQPSLTGAKVTRLQGQVQVQQSSVWRLLQEGEQLAENTLLKLTRGAHLTLRYRSDGHREEAQGPGQLVVGKAETSGGAKVERFGFTSRPLQIPRSGGMDAVGGMVDNTSKRAAPPPGMMAVRPIPTIVKPTTASLPEPPTLQPAAPIGSPRGGTSENFPPQLQEPDPAPLAVVWGTEGPTLSNPHSGALQIGAFRGEVIVFQDDVEVGRARVTDDAPFPLERYAAESDGLFRVELSDEGAPRGSMTFRALDSDEREELKQLSALGESASPEEHLRRMDRYSALGAYHQAAEEGKKWILASEPDKAGAVLQVVYDLNRDLLKDPRQTEFWKDWAELKHVPLIP
ncbi:hypothetical protein ABS71_15300 [bacterium SCN 62-11]|nr:MAG: hypothetical protein ABS71_15300 [bacterium SCN 62-11]